jgi:hypothetical protein
MPKLTDPSYISEHMFDKVVREKFQDNADDPAVRDQAMKMLAFFRAGKLTTKSSLMCCTPPEPLDARQPKELQK